MMYFYSDMSDEQNRSKRTERIFWTFKETQAILAVSKFGLSKLMKNGLASHRIGRKIVFLKEDVEECRRSH